MFMIDDAHFMSNQYHLYFTYTMWFIAVLFICDWCAFVLNNMVLPYSFMPSLVVTLYVIHIDVFMWAGSSRFDMRVFLVKCLALLAFHIYKLQQNMNRINIVFAIYTVGHLLFVVYKMNYMEAKYRCEEYYDEPNCPTGSFLAILFGSAKE